MGSNNVAPAMAGDLVSGTELSGRYRIRGVLARGGMGVVYEAEHLTLERDVAIKTLKPVLLTDPEAVARFTREARLAASIGHPGIVTVFDLATDQGITFLAMERLHGEDLRNRLLRTGALAIADVVRLGRELANAIAAAHGCGVLHRDLSPRNVFLHEVYGRESVKVLDFGIAKLTEPRPADASTQSQQLLGTLLYMAPERIAGEPGIDPRVDVYSIGAILYEAATGIAPFSARTHSELALKIALERPPALSDHRPDAPLELVRLIERAMHKDPAARWSSVAELAHALAELAGRGPGDEAAGAGASVDSTAPSPRALLGLAPRSRLGARRVTFAALGSVLLLACALTAALASRPAAREPSSLAARRAQRAAQTAQRREPTAVPPVAIAAALVEPPPAARAKPASRSASAHRPQTATASRALAVVTHPEGALVSAPGTVPCRAPCSLQVSGAALVVQARLSGHRTTRRHLSAPWPARLELHLEPVPAGSEHMESPQALEPLPPLLPL